MNALTTSMVHDNGDHIGAGGGAAVMEDPHTPGSDCNSNPATDPISQDLIGSEFVQDNLEYQWFIDYGYRDGALHTHPSVLSSLSASYNRDDLGYYDDLARNLDANLAEVDMESFRTADIHTLLTALPVMYTDPVQHSESNYQRERYASISGSVMEKLDFDSSISPHTSSQGEDSACSTTDTMSICKSSLLFSPVKETPVLPPGGSYSVDSLDCEDMLLTCQANNKNNYTIAFEGSITMYSDGSQDFENQSNQEKQKTYEAPESYYNRKLGLKNTLNLSMARSDSKIYTTWSNLKRCSVNSAMTRHPSGNNNTIPNLLQATGNMTFNLGKKSQSLPDLTETRELRQANFPLNFSVDSAESNNHAANHQSFGSVMSRSMNEDSSESIGNTSTGKKLQNLSLVKLFMKQKSMSAEGMSLTLDQSGSTSDGGWPTSNSDSTSKTNTHTQILRYNINHTGNDRQPENDFSINWVKGDDYYNNRAPETLAETFDGVPRKRSPPIQEYEEESESSVSVEELSESTSKSDCCPLDDASSKDRKALNSVHSGPEQRPKNAWSHSSEKQRPPCKTTGIQAVAEVEDNGVQTSLVYPAADCPPLRETVVKKKPVYVVYPNYALPDLSFLNSKDGTFENVALKPQCFDKGRTDWQRPGRTGRPFSCNDIDVLKQRGFSHVKDWESLTFLLPTEYKKILQDVPEVSRHIKLNEDGKKPLFCLSPPMRHRTRTIGEMGTNANASSTSSTATQPSSGYRGSSTILTDSSTNQQGVPNNAANPLYLYRYDSVSSEASLVCQDAKLHRPGCQTRTNCPTLPKRSISLPHGEKESNDSCSNGKVPPRPPLPRGILRKKKSTANKRYSMFEIGGVEEIDDRQSPEVNKRMSLQEPYYLNNDIQVLRHGRIIDSEKDVDEMEERYYAERLKDVNRADLGTDDTESNEDIKQLEEYLKRSGFSSQSSDASDDNSDLKLRSYVKRFLALKINKDITKTIDMIDSQKKTVSFAVHQRKKFLDNNKTSILDVTSNLNDDRPIVTESGETSSELRLMNLEEKKGMIRSVSKAVDLLLRYWHEEPIQNRLDYNDKNECSQLCLSNLCPALYAIMSDGLKPQLNTTFGPITNSVWQVVEASSQQGPLTKTLNELVQKINGEDFMTEGMLKFHAFVFGLLNLRALDAWFAYLCTRESILRKHYNSNGLFVDALACVDAREVVDTFLETLQPLALCPFQLDLLYQCRQLHNSFENMTNHAINATTLRTAESPKERALDKSEIRNDITSPKKVRPRSCIAYSNYNDKQGIVHKTNLDSTTAKKRWSNVPINPKLFHAFDKLASEDSEDYTDSLEHSPSNRAAAKQQAPTKLSSVGPKVDETDPISGEIKFRKLQEKWELMTGKDEAKEQILTPSPQSPVRTPTSLGKSKIPRLLTSPVRQPANPITGPVKSAKSPVSGIPALKKPIAITKVALRKSADLKGRDVPGRTSRVDQDAVGGVRSHSTRPSSLPYKCNGVTAKEKCLASPHRRAASTSLPRPTIATASRNPQLKPTLKEVRTLTHRLPSDNGHLSFGEGERLKVILEVDAKWLLCARGESKGLVPRACVHALQT